MKVVHTVKIYLFLKEKFILLERLGFLQRNISLCLAQIQYMYCLWKYMSHTKTYIFQSILKRFFFSWFRRLILECQMFILLVSFSSICFTYFSMSLLMCLLRSSPLRISSTLAAMFKTSFYLSWNPAVNSSMLCMTNFYEQRAWKLFYRKHCGHEQDLDTVT